MTPDMLLAEIARALRQCYPERAESMIAEVERRFLPDAFFEMSVNQTVSDQMLRSQMDRGALIGSLARSIQERLALALSREVITTTITQQPRDPATRQVVFTGSVTLGKGGIEMSLAV